MECSSGNREGVQVFPDDDHRFPIQYLWRAIKVEAPSRRFFYGLANNARSTTSLFQARYGLGVLVLAVYVHAAETPMKGERLPARIACA